MGEGKKQVWVVDDSLALSAILRAKTKDAPYDIVAITAPDEAINKMVTKPPSIIISDFNIINDGDGVTVVEAAKKHAIPVAMVSATEKVAAEAKKAEVPFFAKKSGYVDELIKHINTTLGHMPSAQQTTSTHSR
jgi:DNA-binding NtrC family response regulator